MPELPEVEATRRLLARWTGQRVVEVDVVEPTTIRRPGATSPSAFDSVGLEVLRGAEGGVWAPPTRHGKRMGARIGATGLWIHLGMTGRFVPWGAGRFERLRFRFSSGDAVAFDDARRFGHFAVTEAAVDRDLGPDALATDATTLAGRWRGRRPIHAALLDQRALAGVGNIHAAEALHRAGIAPARIADSLSAAERLSLANAVHAQLQSAVAAIDPAGIRWVADGDGDLDLHVYERQGKPCRRCGAPLERLVLGGGARAIVAVANADGGAHCPGRPPTLAARAATPTWCGCH